MGLYRLIESRARGARDYARLDPVKMSLCAALRGAAERCPGGRWLDIGAGSGVHREIFEGRFSEYVALDPSPRGPGVLPASGEALPFGPARFDVVVISEVLEHVPKPEKVLEEARRVLRADGRLLVTAPFVFYEHESPHDYRRWSKHGLRLLLEGAGFEVLELAPTCGILAVVEILESMALLGTLGRLPGMWEPALALNGFWMKHVVLPLDRRFDRSKRWAQGHLALARRP